MHFSAPLLLICALFIANDVKADFAAGAFREVPGEENALMLSGQIDSGSELDFRIALLETGADTLHLDSPGGSVGTALEIAAIVSDRQMRTVIPEGASCSSACAFIFLAGAERLAEGDLGVHQFYADEQSVEVDAQTRLETQAFTAAIIQYLDSFGTPAIVYVRMFSTPPDDMYWFSREELSEHGINTAQIDVEETDAVSVEPAADEPATQASIASSLKPRSGIDADGLSNPSFDCGMAETFDEIAICADPFLGELDRRLNAIYNVVRQNGSEESRRQTQVAQRDWLLARRQCGNDVACITESYLGRIAEMNSER